MFESNQNLYLHRTQSWVVVFFFSKIQVRTIKTLKYFLNNPHLSFRKLNRLK